MKFFQLNIFRCSLVITFFVFSACTREIPQLTAKDTDVSSAATLQVFNATVKSVRNYVYVDGTPVSGAVFGSGGIFPNTAYGIKLTTGMHSILIKDTASSTTQVPLTFSQSFDAGKSYTTFTYDTITTIKQLTVANNIVVPTDTSSRLRLANFIYNASAIPNVDVYSFRRISGMPVFLGGSPVFTGNTPIFSNIVTNVVTDFIPYPSGLPDTFYVYATGTTSPLIVKAVVPSLVPTRSYTTALTGSFRGARAIGTFATY